MRNEDLPGLERIKERMRRVGFAGDFVCVKYSLRPELIGYSVACVSRSGSTHLQPINEFVEMDPFPPGDPVCLLILRAIEADRREVPPTSAEDIFRLAPRTDTFEYRDTDHISGVCANPQCGGSNVDYGSFNYDEDGVGQRAICQDCGSEWVDVYERHVVVNLTIPKGDT